MGKPSRLRDMCGAGQFAQFVLIRVFSVPK